MIGGVTNGEEAVREWPLAVDEAAEPVLQLTHDEDGRVRPGDRLCRPAGEPGCDGGKGAEEALEAGGVDQRLQVRIPDRRPDRDREAPCVAGEDRDLHPPEVARDERRPAARHPTAALTIEARVVEDAAGCAPLARWRRPERSEPLWCA